MPTHPLSSCCCTDGASILDGKGIAAVWQREVAAEVAEVTAQAGRPPGLAVVLVGGRPDSKIYVHRKEEACRKARRLHVALYPTWKSTPASSWRENQWIPVGRQIRCKSRLH